jgi:hypothetical protein
MRVQQKMNAVGDLYCLYLANPVEICIQTPQCPKRFAGVGGQKQKSSAS